ncbi:MAG: acetate kinase [Bacteroidetes bacterium GWF2_38_335]|nr:MAG: acetate kinase [Bacteroidetes bacterium GWF2_38_335]OFY79015.1 MAG: acetate kinase [Bacteroidetes bacterium RIFOXYA12_FULL_38_20]HBS86092.1 acetate kinase [Bacteroidales bacterium]
MKVLVLNCGSSSIKYQFLEMAGEPILLAKGLLERIGLKDGEFAHKTSDGKKHQVVVDIPDHTFGISILLEALTNKDHGVITSVKEIDAVGHRVVHGGEEFTKSVLINEQIKAKIKECIELAPLHNPANLKGIEAMEANAPGIPQVAVFDTSFHQTMPKHAYIYGLPYEYYEKYKVRRYGFHGTSHKYVAQRTAEFLGKDYNKLKIITCHLGNGASITAVKNGISVDTSMGMTPVEGLLMGTRCGDTGLGTFLYLIEKENMCYKDVNTLINKKGGLLGISGLSPDMRDLKQAADEGHERAALAIEIFAYRVKKYIGAYTMAMGGVDAIVFTGGIGENAKFIREMICSDMGFIGLHFDKDKNNQVQGVAAEISTPASTVKCIVMPTNEELVIATDTKEIVGKIGGCGCGCKH